MKESTKTLGGFSLAVAVIAIVWTLWFSPVANSSSCTEIGEESTPVYAAQGPVRPVPTFLNDIAIREEVYFRENGQYVDPTETPEMRADLTRIDEEGYTRFIILGYKDDKMNSYHIQAWKDRDCNNGARMSYYIQERDVLRYRCSTENGVAGADDARVE